MRSLIIAAWFFTFGYAVHATGTDQAIKELFFDTFDELNRRTARVYLDEQAKRLV